MKLRSILILAVFCAGLLATSGGSQDLRKPPEDKKKVPDEKKGEKDNKLAELMALKLEHAQKVLQGIALNDFKGIAQHADDLMLISKKAEWKVMKTPEYETYSNEFRRAAESMVTNAKAKNTDGAALAYVEMTLTCVKCHKHVREVRSTRLDLPASERDHYAFDK